MHSHKKVLHRDLKRGNMLVKKNGWVKISDFGWARVMPKNPPSGQVGSRAEILLTQCIGTFWYMAPESLLMCQEYSYPVDLWSIGCILAELITHRIFLPGKNQL